MSYDPELHHRRSIRLDHYDYSQEGYYFITLCVQNRACLFGEIAEDKMELNPAGKMIHKNWNELPKRFLNFMSCILFVSTSAITQKNGPQMAYSQTISSHPKGEYKIRPYTIILRRAYSSHKILK